MLSSRGKKGRKEEKKEVTPITLECGHPSSGGSFDQQIESYGDVWSSSPFTLAAIYYYIINKIYIYVIISSIFSMFLCRKSLSRTHFLIQHLTITTIFTYYYTQYQPTVRYRLPNVCIITAVIFYISAKGDRKKHFSLTEFS